MLRIFTTQVTGATKALLHKEEDIEDAARLLCQALASDDHVYIAAFGEMKAIEAEAVHGHEALPNVHSLDEYGIDSVTERDRVVLATRFSHDEEAVQLARKLARRGIPFLSITTITDNDEASLVSYSDQTLDLNLHQGLVPDEDGTRVGYPASLLGLHAYFLLALTVREILAEVG